MILWGGTLRDAASNISFLKGLFHIPKSATNTELANILIADGEVAIGCILEVRISNSLTTLIDEEVGLACIGTIEDVEVCTIKVCIVAELRNAGLRLVTPFCSGIGNKVV